MRIYKAALKVCICGALVLWIRKSEDQRSIIRAHDSFFNMGLYSHGPNQVLDINPTFYTYEIIKDIESVVPMNKLFCT